MTEDRSGLLVGKLLAGDCAEGQMHFLLINAEFFEEVVRK